MRTKSAAVPFPVQRALRRLGSDIRDARRRRRIPLGLLAERTSLSRLTIGKIEKGDGGVAIKNLAAVLFSLGMIERLAEVADPRFDSTGLALEEERLPKRVRLPKEPS